MADTPTTTPPPGTVLISSDGTPAGTAVGVVGPDGKAMPLRTVRAITLRATPEGVVAFLEILGCAAHVFSQPPHVSWNYADDRAPKNG